MTASAVHQRRGSVPDSVLLIPEIRDYERINAELVVRLDEGQRHVRLVGAEGQRLLAAGLSGTWSALVEIEGETGPELAAALNAPGLTVVGLGGTRDGAASGVRAGTVILLGVAGDALGIGQKGGVVLAFAGAGHRIGLGQSGGSLVVLGPTGRLFGERQSGGRLFAYADRVGPHAGHGRRGGSLVLVPGASRSASDLGIAPEDAEFFRGLLRESAPWLARVRPSPV